MAISDIFKKKKELKKQELEKIEEPKKEEKIEKPEGEEVKMGKPVFPAGAAIRHKKRIPEMAFRILISPHVTEKATDLESQNQYVFKVFPRANKIEIRKAIEEVYGVKVVSVNIINVPRKPRKLGKTIGWKKGFKKAIVKIKEGQKIETLVR